MKTIQPKWAALAGITGTTLILIAALRVLADVPQPVLTIAPLGSNQFNVVITNGVSTTNYTLFWTPALNDQFYPWQVLGVSQVGQTNFPIIGGEWQAGWFRVLVGSDQDGDGSPEWQDAQPLNPAVGILSVIIDSPTNGMVLQ